MKKLLRLPQVMEMTGKSRSSIYADPTFPERVKIGSRSSAWLQEEVANWIDDRLADRDAN